MIWRQVLRRISHVLIQVEQFPPLGLKGEEAGRQPAEVLKVDDVDVIRIHTAKRDEGV